MINNSYLKNLEHISWIANIFSDDDRATGRDDRHTEREFDFYSFCPAYSRIDNRKNLDEYNGCNN